MFASWSNDAKEFEWFIESIALIEGTKSVYCSLSVSKRFTAIFYPVHWEQELRIRLRARALTVSSVSRIWTDLAAVSGTSWRP
jgi:hypothetical protein